MTIRLNLKRTHGRITTIRAIIRLHGIKTTLSTGVQVQIHDWDRRRERCRSDTEANARLENAVSRIKEFIAQHHRPPAHAELFKKTPDISIPTAAHAHGQQLVAFGASPNTAKAYTTLSNNLRRFAGDITFAQLNTDFIRRFRLWLYKKDYSDSHIHKTLKTLKTVVRPHRPDLLPHIQPPTARHRDEIYLTLNEIEQIAQLQLTDRLHRARNLFLLACYTGQRYSDLEQIRPERITGNQLHLTQQKTGETVTLPLSEKIKAILADKQPANVSNQELNRCMKTIGQLAGLTQNIQITIYKAGRPHVQQFQKWQLIKSHTGRRTFATNALLAGIPIHVIMKFTGHRTEREFKRYIRAGGIEITSAYLTHPFFEQ